MKTKVLSIDGTSAKEITLPDVFEEQVRPDIIKRAFLALRTNSLQLKYTNLLAGVKTSANYFGRRHKVYRTSINLGKARLPKIKLAQGHLGEVRIVPQSRTGRRAHPPKMEKILIEKINDKERKKAIRSAIAATADIKLVSQRGHKIKELTLPLVIEDKIESVSKTKDIKAILEKLKLTDDLARGEDVTMKSGQGKGRGRVYRRKSSVLIVVKDNKGILKAAQNLPGVDVTLAKNLNAEKLAPGGVAGRLTVYSESAISELKTLFK